ncbi:RNA exonuclease 4 isoform X3 [Trifolium pratense]|uniref:RNA exonuclease 4 isoform X3 n=1 Tax=Trifolium pratense TaxID=57577 RepID=UPI001E69770E|nr:RNA exonuclease 4 isoform X3 [Trifolium pratense]
MMMQDVVAMDCEMVGVGQGNKSALARVTLVNKWGNVIYDEFVRPMERVVDFRTKISGIRPRDLRKAKDFSTAQKKVAELIHGRILVGHALSNDLKVHFSGYSFSFFLRFTCIFSYQSVICEPGTVLLQALLLSHPKKDIRDTSEYPPFLRSSGRVALRHLASEHLGAKIQTGEHCPIDDARAAMMLYQKNRKEWEKSTKGNFRSKQKQKKRKKIKDAE